MAEIASLKKYQKKNWLVTLKVKKNLLLLSPYKIIADVLCEWNEDYHAAYCSGRCDLPEKFLQRDGKYIAELCNANNLFLRTIWGKEWAQCIANVLKYRCCGIYPCGMARASLRTEKEPVAYAAAIWILLRRFFDISQYTLSPSEFLECYFANPEGFDSAYGEVIALMLAVELDRSNPLVSEKCKDAIYQNEGTTTYPIIQALFYSKNESSWKMAGDLLRAAKLQEGLRQAIIENCSNGRLDAFLFILKIIREDELLRYSSTVRAFDTWTLCGMDAASPETVKRAFSMSVELLEHPERQAEAICSDHPLRVYFGLWAMANREARSAVEEVEQIVIKNIAPLQCQCAALAFLLITGANFTPEFVLEHLWRHIDNPVISAYLWKNFNRFAISNPSVALYDGFKALLPTLPVKTQKITNPIFDWQELELSENRVWDVLISIAEEANRAEIYNDLLTFMERMSTERRHAVVDRILEYIVPVPAETQHGMGVHLGSLASEDAAKRKKMQTTMQMREMVFQLFNDKSIPIREHALSIARRLKLSEAELLNVENMLSLKTPNIRKEALMTIRANGSETASAARLRSSGNAEKIAAANELVPPQAAPELNMSNGFGLYDPNHEPVYVMPPADRNYHPQSLIKNYGKKAITILQGLDQLFEKHRNDEICVDNPWGRESTTVDAYISRPILSCDVIGSCDHIPDEMAKYLSDHVKATEEVFAMLSILAAGNKSEKYIQVFYGELPEPDISLRYREGLAWITKVQFENNPEFTKMLGAVIAAIAEYTPQKFWDMGEKDGYSSFPYFCMPPIRLWWNLASKVPLTDDFLVCLLILHAHFRRQNQVRFSPYTPKAMQQARNKGLINDGEIARYLLSGSVWDWSYSMLGFLKHPATEHVIQQLLEIELARGDMPTELSQYMIRLPLLRGADNYVRLLSALGNYKFVRGYMESGDDKSTVFSHLIKVCRPLPEDNAETLRKIIALYPVPDKKLLESAMYSPAWLGIVGEYLKIPELPLAGWYFHAHVNENFSSEKETFVAKYSAITPQEFNDGAFDVDWFREAYKAVGPEMFAKLYDAAKYISGGANHRRSQIFADAALGKLKGADIELNMTTKRNKEYVMAYGILPGKDFLHRYEKLAQFRKESRQFGGQRQVSEKLAVEIALGNLARTAGFSDVNRFLWRMESAQLDALKSLFTPQAVGDVAISLSIDESGRASMKIEKNGKTIKSLPAALKKNEIVLELQEAVKKLRDQHSRAKKSLEEAMIREDVFEYTEVEELISNPVLGPLASKLLWQSGERIDFFDNLPEAPLTIAHPVGLLKSGHWAEFQRHALGMKLLQPFKQIFRELYTLNPDEKLDGMKSDRYSGNQVMPKQAVALMRTRGWTVDMEEGLQKVFHKRNMIAKIYALADWFSPADVEPPMLEYVQFEHRRTGEIIPLETIPPVLFSEVMRDLDLMVSVAHAGGVDPEASHSTVEMRAALITAMLPLFKLANVRIEKSHAFITGKFGEYNVHLGSGVCHQQAHGMLNILPVHSQTRGRLFLPFADDDPKTSEIVTKILFLAEDDKIKDPSILEQIKGGLQ